MKYISKKKTIHRHAPLTALLAIASIWFLEILYSTMDYTGGLLQGTELVAFYLVCCGTLLVVWPLLSLAASGLARAVRWFDSHLWLSRVCFVFEGLIWAGFFQWMIWAPSGGHREWWWLLLPLVVSGALVVWRFPGRAGNSVGATAVASLGAAAWNINLVWAFENQFFTTGFSLEAGRPMLTAVAAVATFVITSIVTHGFFLRPLAQRGVWVPFACMGLSVCLYHVNAAAFVNNYLWAHLRIAGIGVLSAWALGEWITTRILRKPGWNILHYIAPIIGVLSMVAVALVPCSEPAYYAAAVHTRFTRQALELMAHAKNLFVGRARHDAANALTHTGHPITLSAGWSRPPLDGAVLFLLDMKRQKDIPLYRDEPGEMPNTARCFEDGFRFRNAYASSNVTKVTYPGLFSSAYGATRQDHWPDGFNRGPWQKHHRRAVLGSIFKKAGFRTMALVGGYYNVHFFESGREEFKGFDKVLADGPKAKTSEEGMTRLYRQTGGVVPTEGKFLSVVMIQLHNNRHIGFIDSYIGKVCDELKKKGRYDRTVLLLTADHGVQYREHGSKTYGHSLFNEEILVPHILRIPGLKGRYLDTNINSLDVLPSLIDLFGIETEVLVEGKSYLPWLTGSSAKAPLIFSESRTDVQSIAVIDGDYKLIRWQPTGAEAMFHIGDSPKERTSIAASPANEETYQRLSHEIDLFQKTRGAGETFLHRR
ncbi:MAG: sulfatase-like hydrolase/transferase [Proteobacteria bacterium]|nr:sulfatase-like hydrolase/transferase [Pseudomonadota bacterium]